MTIIKNNTKTTIQYLTVTAAFGLPLILGIYTLGHMIVGYNQFTREYDLKFQSPVIIQNLFNIQPRPAATTLKDQ